jgi:CRISPR-associated protein Cas1
MITQVSSVLSSVMDESAEPLRVMALHALAYCERLFYLEEVEQIRVADAAVFEGRRAHEELEEGALTSFTLESTELGLKGKVDALRKRDGVLIPIEVKKGHVAPGDGPLAAWETDRVQVAAYAMLLESTQEVVLSEGRVRYLADHKTVRVPIDEPLRDKVQGMIQRARALRLQVVRPPVTDNERLCPRCSLAPVCLPEEERLAQDSERETVRLFPPHSDRQVVHVLEHGAQVGRQGDLLQIRMRDEDPQVFPVRQVGAVVLHGYSQISTQALRMCADHDIGVQWVSPSGQIVGALLPAAQSPQRHLRQFRALDRDEERLRLAKLLVTAKVQAQLQFLLRSTRGQQRSQETESVIERIRESLRHIDSLTKVDELLGREGSAAGAYFEGLGRLLRDDLDPRLKFVHRSRRPSTDRFNCLLNYGYGMLYRECLSAIVAVGLHPGLGIYHQPRSAASPLVLDVMELFRVPLVDMAVVGAVNRDTFDAERDFEERGHQIWLTQSGKAKATEVFERRKQETWKHSVVGYSLSYARMIELEVRLLEKEYSGEGQLFARFRLR